MFYKETTPGHHEKYDEDWHVQITDLIGKTLKEVNRGRDNDELFFVTEDGDEYVMYHSQDCCESVTIEDINGNLDDLVGKPIKIAREDSNHADRDYESMTWTFYNFATDNGYVTIRWYGVSNGYYSEKVDFHKITPTGEFWDDQVKIGKMMLGLASGSRL
jgi:hypothetical protein